MLYWRRYFFNVIIIIIEFEHENYHFFICSKQLKEFEGKETAQLVDRYKFLDLYPCTAIELRSIGYKEVFVGGRNAANVAASKTDENEEAIAALPRPDISQMIPFKPKVSPIAGEHPVPGKIIYQNLNYELI